MVDVILTGVPRSGTTLTCHLLNHLDDVVALHEPMNVAAIGALPSTERLDRISAFFSEQRRSLLATGVAVTKHVDGEVPKNPIGDVRNSKGLRVSTGSHGSVAFNKSLRADFTLAVKHPSYFTAELPRLVDHFPAFAVVRHPLSVLASWTLCELPVHYGRAPAAERIDAELRSRLDALDDVLERQLVLLSWFFERYAKYLHDSQIIRYEEVVATKGSSLARVHPSAEGLRVELQSRNKAYPEDLLEHLRSRLYASDGAYWHFYEREHP